MNKKYRAVFLVSFLILAEALLAGSPKGSDVEYFFELLTRSDAPTLAEYEAVGGSELSLEHEMCVQRGWDVESRKCLEYTKMRRSSSDEIPSLRLKCIREYADTAGKEYSILQVDRGNGAQYPFERIRAAIGNATIVVRHATEESFPHGATIVVSQIDGKEISDIGC